MRCARRRRSTLRRRPVELVRAPEPAAVLEGVRRTRPMRCCTSACCTVTQLLAPVCPFTADALYQNLAGTDRVRAPRRLARRRRPCDRSGSRVRHGTRTGVRVARTQRTRRDRSSRSANHSPRAIALVPRRHRDRCRCRGRDRRRAEREDASRRSRRSRACSTTPCSRTSASSGRRSAPRLPEVKELLGEADGGEVRAALDAGGVYVLDVDGAAIELTADDLQIRASSHEELALAQDGALAVAIDTHARRRPAARRARPRARPRAQRPAQGDRVRDRRPDPWCGSTRTATWPPRSPASDWIARRGPCHEPRGRADPRRGRRRGNAPSTAAPCGARSRASRRPSAARPGSAWRRQRPRRRNSPPRVVLVERICGCAPCRGGRAGSRR